MSLELPNSDSLASILAEYNADQHRERIHQVHVLASHAIEGALLLIGQANAVCARCSQTFTLTRTVVDDWGNATVSGGERVNGEYVCDACSFDAYCDYLDIKFGPAARPTWQAPTDAEIQAMERDELVDAGWFDPLPPSAPDTYGDERPDPVVTGDAEWFRLTDSAEEDL